MTNIKINFSERAIEMTKKFERKAQRYVSDAYKELQEARRDYPSFRVVVKSSSRKNKDSFKGLTYEYMEKYISLHDPENVIMGDFKILRGINEDDPEMMTASASFKEIREWFFVTYPEIAEFQKKRENILAKVVKEVA